MYYRWAKNPINIKQIIFLLGKPNSVYLSNPAQEQTLLVSTLRINQVKKKNPELFSI